MAAKPKTTKRARELDENKRAAARRCFLYDELGEAQIAARFHVAVAYILRLASEERWQEELDRLCRCAEYIEAHDKQIKTIADCKSKIEVVHAKTSLVRARAQHALARGLADEASRATTPEEFHDVARALGPASQDVTSGRLAVGLPNQVTFVTQIAPDAAIEAMQAAVAAAGDEVSDDEAVQPETDAGVVPDDRMAPAPRTTRGP